VGNYVHGRALVVLKAGPWSGATACAVLAFAVASCAHGEARLARVPNVALIGPDGRAVDLRSETARARLTLLVFFSPRCRCLDAHEPRLRALDSEYRPRGLRLFMIDSEMGGSPERDAVEARRRGYDFPILFDRGAKLAHSLDAAYATYSVLLDADGVIRYEGGIDSDRTHLTDDATPYVRRAIDDLLGGRPVRLAAGKCLGCALEGW
jgi:Redoxin